MRSDELSLAPSEKSAYGVFATLGSLMFGFIVWAIHLLLVYGFTAVACSHLSDLGQQPVLSKGILGGITIAALIIVAWHGWRHYRRSDELEGGQRFVSWLNATLDASAWLAILWQALPIATIGMCE